MYSFLGVFSVVFFNKNLEMLHSDGVGLLRQHAQIYDGNSG